MQSTCEICTNVFEHNSGAVRRCCPDHQHLYRTLPPLPPMFCDNCGEEIVKDKKKGKRFCSQRCFGDWQSKNKVAENHPSYKPVERTCEHCGNMFITKPSEVAKGWGRFCSKLCHYHHGSIECTCQQCGNSFRSPKNQVESGGGKFCSKACVHKWQKAHPPTRPLPVMRGLDHPNFKGGYGPIYYGPNWYEQRRKARKRDKHTCQKCGITEKELGQHLDVHHIVSFRSFGYVVGENNNYLLANGLKNLQSLCRSCHMKTEANESSPLQMPLLLSFP